MLKITVIVIAVVIVAVLGYAASRPDTFRVERSISINAPAQKIYPLISDLHNWLVWSPYEKKDPSMQRTFSDNSSGVGARYAWDGNSDIGAGSMEITDAVAPEKIGIRLQFLRPFKATNRAEFVLQPQDGATRLTWAMSGEANLVSKVMGLFFDMDRMIGQDFEAGLAELKRIGEAG